MKISNNVLIILTILLLVFSAMNLALISKFKQPTGKTTGVVKLSVQERPSPPAPSAPSVTPPAVPAPPVTPAPSVIPICAEKWGCTDWPTTCPPTGIQTRECREVNGCLTEAERPIQQRFCILLNENRAEIRLSPTSVIVSIALGISAFFTLIFNALIRFFSRIFSAIFG